MPNSCVYVHPVISIGRKSRGYVLLAVLLSSGVFSGQASAQDASRNADLPLVVAALSATDGWLREAGTAPATVVIYTFDVGLDGLRDRGEFAVRAASTGSARWADSIDRESGCPVESTPANCPDGAANVLVTIGGILSLRSGEYSVQFEVSRPSLQSIGVWETEVRYFRLQRRENGTFARVGEVGRLIP